MKILKVLSKRCQGCLKPQKPSIYKGTEKGVLFTNERHAFFLCGKKPDSQWPGRKEPKLLARNYCHNSLHIYHNCGEIFLQSHSNQARRIRSSEPVGCFHFSVFLFYSVADAQLGGKFFTALKFKPGFVCFICTCNAVSPALGFSNPAIIPHRTGFAFLDAEAVVVVAHSVPPYAFICRQHAG